MQGRLPRRTLRDRKGREEDLRFVTEHSSKLSGGGISQPTPERARCKDGEPGLNPTSCKGGETLRLRSAQAWGTKLFGAQGVHGFDAGGTAGGDEARQDREGDEDQNRADQGHGIVGTYAVQLRCHQPSTEESNRNPDA